MPVSFMQEVRVEGPEAPASGVLRMMTPTVPECLLKTERYQKWKTGIVKQMLDDETMVIHSFDNNNVYSTYYNIKTLTHTLGVGHFELTKPTIKHAIEASFKNWDDKDYEAGAYYAFHTDDSVERKKDHWYASNFDENRGKTMLFGPDVDVPPMPNCEVTEDYYGGNYSLKMAMRSVAQKKMEEEQKLKDEQKKMEDDEFERNREDALKEIDVLEHQMKDVEEVKGKNDEAYTTLKNKHYWAVWNYEDVYVYGRCEECGCSIKMFGHAGCYCYKDVIMDERR
jgi:hypothetical protein